MPKKDTRDSFIMKATKRHNGFYDYSKVEYINARTKVCIICPIHGEFWQKPNQHVFGQGCDKCAHEKLWASNKSVNKFIAKATKIHNGKYDYSNVDYNGYEKHVCIICPMHGEFWQTPHRHLKNHGCPICNESQLEKSICNFLADKEIEFEQQKTFEWLKYVRQQYLDFYLPKYNIAIECQGIQHFKPSHTFGSKRHSKEDIYDDTIKRDINKRQLCFEHGIKILYFSNLDIEYPYEVLVDRDILLEKIINNKV